MKPCVLAFVYDILDYKGGAIMGSWFSNLHIRKTEKIGREVVCDCIIDILAKKKYILADYVEDADIAVAVVDAQNGQWMTICSGVLAHDDPDSCKDVASQFSAKLHADVMGIACFDSDYLYLNLHNADEGTDAWIGIGAGKEIGITRRNNVNAWKKKVEDYPVFSTAVKGTYICADDFLTAGEGCLELRAEQARLSLDNLKNSLFQQDTCYLYFRQEEEICNTGPDLRICYMDYAVPCFAGKENSVTFLNVGDEFSGLSVYFLGSYVEHEEIVFSDIRLVHPQQSFMDLQLKKIQLPDGRWAYYSHIPDILMPPGVRGRMLPEKRRQMEMDRMRKISFVPHGNPHKMLDVTVVIVPDGKPVNQAEWNIWYSYGSKEEFIKHHNKIWKRVRALGEDPNQCLPLLRIEDFET